MTRQKGSENPGKPSRAQRHRAKRRQEMETVRKALQRLREEGALEDLIEQPVERETITRFLDRKG